MAGPIDPPVVSLVEPSLESMAEHYKEHPNVIGWQTDNEFGGTDCRCHRCRGRFQDWLDAMMEHGAEATKPVALVRWATTGRQETLTGVLGDIAEKVKAAGFKALARRLCVGHAYAFPWDWGIDVEVFGTTIRSHTVRPVSWTRGPGSVCLRPVLSPLMKRYRTG